MANIALTYRCNLNCPYCFANEFVNKQKADISEENFDKAVQFLVDSHADSIGLIGGEPLLHPNFGTFMEKLIDHPGVRAIRVYTNGLWIDKYVPLLVNPKVSLLVNCNSPTQIGEANYARTVQNLDILHLQYRMKLRCSLGINLYDTDMDYQYICELLKRYSLHTLRISITVPDFSKQNCCDVLEYFKSKKQFLLRFFRDMDAIQVVPHYDCNKPPYCIWTEEEKQWLKNYIQKYPVSETNLIGDHSFCHPVVDILPNLQAVRCLGLSEYTKVKLSDFNTLEDLQQYYIGSVDYAGYNMAAFSDCKDCMKRKVQLCTAGCLGFKWPRIQKVQSYLEQL